MLDKKTIAAMSVRIGADTTSFKTGVNNARKQTSLLTKQLKSLGGILAGAFTVSAITRFMAKNVELYNIQAQAEAGLLTALKGREDIQERLIKQAKYLQGQTLFGDEQTIEAQGRLATILGENEEAIRRLTPLVQDFATAKNMQLADAAELVAKTVGSSTNALSRYGIQIEGAVGSAERLDNVVRELNKQVGGRAKAAAEAGMGAVTQLKNEWGDFREELGEKTAPALLETTRQLRGLLKVASSEDLKWWQKLLALNASLQSGIELTTDDITEFTESIDSANKSIDKISDTVAEFKASIGSLDKDIVESNDDIEEQIPLIEKARIELEKYSEEAEKAITEEQLIKANRKIQYYQEEIKRLKELGTHLKEIINLSKAYSIEPPTRVISKEPVKDTGVGISRGLADFEEQRERLIDLANQFRELGLSIQGFDFTGNFEQQIQKFTSILEAYVNSIQDFNHIIRQSFSDMAISIGESFGEMIATGKGFNANILLESLANAAEQLGKLAIQMGIATIAIGKALKPPFKGSLAIAAGIALIALAKMVKSSMADIASGGSINPNAGSLSNVTSPGGEGGGTEFMNRNYGEIQPQVNINLEGEFELKGEDLRLSVNRADKRHNQGL